MGPRDDCYDDDDAALEEKKKKRGKKNKIKYKVFQTGVPAIFFLSDHLPSLGARRRRRVCVGNNAATSFFGIVLVVVTQSNLPSRAPRRVKLVRVGMQSRLFTFTALSVAHGQVIITRKKEEQNTYAPTTGRRRKRSCCTHFWNIYSQLIVACINRASCIFLF